MTQSEIIVGQFYQNENLPDVIYLGCAKAIDWLNSKDDPDSEEGDEEIPIYGEKFLLVYSSANQCFGHLCNPPEEHAEAFYNLFKPYEKPNHNL